ncbi:2-octaprenyl-3-methyl-6-methoxy-1,4-benzoquinol hydroxylase [Halioglobus sp. HI00S01]|uniref:2-polyprenyl-3-methyl-6-methoxy-1,4-benzoquinone monooxygenase n=1 Tax=Halioglobus sp. HI00S01 TaxID=1822214 RepID=UPI0007C24DE6|nr:2-polyprenyl-3-methyl-6-methoxy-1,4-benzoquinone monooxygenase [Halioglobus sp. HI00S01]KZX58415.1 2-octaprenyl-3-methyl-6-methoxy-1,4-benzoquinol hydroxylase [Halioglobus sp. HI00S01]
MRHRRFSLLDRAITEVDSVMRTITNRGHSAGRASPAEGHSDCELSEGERKHVAGLMRVNHTGEVCAQALYQGQALTARLPKVREKMQTAADEEIDHLVWCEERLRDLNARPSLLNPIWYGTSFAMGALAGAIGDDVSLGFVAATEERVCNHLRDHLKQLPEDDRKSALILQQMLEDEERHGHKALEAGGKDFPTPVKDAMTTVSKVMTETAYRV